MSGIHAVKAIYNSVTLNPEVTFQTSEPLEYRCVTCQFKGNLEQGVEHVVQNQYIVKTPIKKRP